jgi:hypothetical protein
MKVTKLGCVMACKNLGTWLATTWAFVDIQGNLYPFIYALMLYAFISIPTDLYLLNKAHEGVVNNKKVEE